MKRLWLGFALLLAVAGGVWWWFFSGTEEVPVAVRAGPTPEQRAEQAEAKRQLDLAVAAAYPEGTLVTGGASARQFDEHRLVEAPFGPVLVSRGHVLDGAHVDAGVIAVHYLAPSEDGFRLVRSWPEAAAVGSNGDLSEWSVSDKFSDLPMLYAEGGGTGQGYTCSYAKLVELTARGPIEAASIQTVYDDGGARQPGESYQGKIGEIVKGKGFTVAFTGTRSFAEHYVRQGDRFVPQGKSRLPAC